jgi:serine/threonine-protein kinase
MDPEEAAAVQLTRIAAADRPLVSTQLADLWIPQLSSKRPGVVDDGIVWDNTSTLQEYLKFQQRYDAKLLWSGDWSTFDGRNFWVTVVPVTFSSPDGALQWCTDNGFDSWHCLAKVVSTTRPIDGSTKIGS